VGLRLDVPSGVAHIAHIVRMHLHCSPLGCTYRRPPLSKAHGVGLSGDKVPSPEDHSKISLILYNTFCDHMAFKSILMHDCRLSFISIDLKVM